MPLTSQQPQAGYRSRGAFTLLELVLVMVLLTVILAISVPSLRGFVGNSRERDAILQLVSLAQFAKARSAADAKVYRLNFAGGAYWLTMQEGESFVPLGTDLGREFALPDGMQLEAVVNANSGGVSPVDGQPVRADGVSFYPEGRTDTALFRLTAADGRVTLVGCPSPAESFRVVSAEEAARL